MADNTGIEWCDATWNPVVGCGVVSPGCTNCYAMRVAARVERTGVAHYAGLTQPSRAGPVWTGKLALAPDETLAQPLRWKKPRRIFVNSMGDLFHEDVPDAWIDRVFDVMNSARQHTFLVLTKRAARMRDHVCAGLSGALGPLPNVWLGVSVEDQARADARVSLLLQTPAAVRFLSCEPLLGPVDLFRLPGLGRRIRNGPRVDWVIAGGESGRDARPMHPDWARRLRDDCAAAGAPFFFKQWGEWAPRKVHEPHDTLVRRADGHHGPPGTVQGEMIAAMQRVGKRAAGRLLDGVEHNAFPERE